MEWIWNYIMWSILIIYLSLVWNLRRKNSINSKLPPGPRGWPVLGNMLDLGSLPYRNLAALRQKYGPIVWLSLGSLKTMVVLSASAAEELFKNHDISFADRTIVETARSHDYYKNSMGIGSCSIYWRTLKRICTVELFTSKKINETALIRQKCRDDVLLLIEKEVEKGESCGIEVLQFVFPAIFNLIGILTISHDFGNSHSKTSSEFYTAMSGFMKCLGSPNISDLLPWLKWLDLQGLRKQMDRDLGKVIEIISGFVKERAEQQQQEGEISSEKRKDILSVLLDFEGNGKNEPAKLSERGVTIFLTEMFLAGSETTSVSIEWAMCELLQKPEAMIKIKAELNRVVGANKKFEESDIYNLPYLRATVEETLRLHPPAPLLLPRKAIQDTNFMGYNIPKDTQVWVNAWSIGRDEERWEDASTFKPERFLDSNIGYKGQNFEFIPFGAGRRICPGIPLAHQIIPLFLGSLLHHFEWEVCRNANGEATIDMTETMGITVRKTHHLKAIAKRKTT